MIPFSLDVTTFYYPTKIVFGPGAIERLSLETAAFTMSRPLVVTDGGLAKGPVFDRVLGIIRKRCGDAVVFDQVLPNPTEQNVLDGVARYQEAKCDGVIGVGGGSPLDAAKAITLKVTHPLPLADYDDLEDGSDRICHGWLGKLHPVNLVNPVVKPGRILLRSATPVDGNGAAQEGDEPAVNEPRLFHHLSNAVLTRILFDRLGDVAIHVRVPMQKPAERRARRAQIRKIPSAIQAALGFPKIQREKAPTGFQQAEYLTQQPGNVRNVAHAIADRDPIERSIGKAQLADVPRFKVDTSSARSLAPRQFHHSGRDVHAGRFTAAVELPLQQKGNVAGTAGQIEDLVVGLHIGHRH